MRCAGDHNLYGIVLPLDAFRLLKVDRGRRGFIFDTAREDI